MKITLSQLLLLALFGSIALAHDSRAQEVLNRTLTLNQQNLELKDVLRQIEREAKVKFVYSTRIQSGQRISLNVTNRKLSAVLDELLIPAGIDYEVIENRILLTKRRPNRSGLADPEFIQNTTEVNADRTVTGLVTDDSGGSLAGATVSVKGTTRGTSTDASGNYTIIASDQETLVYSFVGFLSKEVAVGNQSRINVTLDSDVRMLAEATVISVGYGEQRRRDVTGAIGSIDVKTLQDVPIQTADQALQGRVAGVDVQTNSGLPGNGMKVNIRGTGTINNSDPLYVIDGYYPADVNSINPNDIASIDILKDASASAIYGVLGANGVVIITTKRAKAGKPTVTLDTYYGVQSPIKFLDLLGARDFATVSNNAKDNALADDNYAAFLSGRPGNIGRIGSTRVPSLGNLDNLPTYDEYQPELAGQRINTDWQRLVTRSAPTSNYNVTASGGNENARILASVGYLQQDGILRGTDFERISARLNGDINYKKLKIGATIYFAQEKRLQNTGGSGPLASVTKASPTLAVYNRDPLYVLGFNGNERDRDGQDAGNPLRDLLINDNRNTAYRGYGTAFVEYEIIPGLKYKINAGTNLSLSSQNNYSPVFYSSSFDRRDLGQNALFQNRFQGVSWLLENTLNYEKQINKHKFSVLAGYVSRNGSNDYFEAQKIGFPAGDRIRVADAGATVTAFNGNRSQTRQIGILGRINYDYNDRYLLTVNIRRDGSSRFGADYRYGVFPSASVGWRVSEENFLKNKIAALSELKFRAGWGQIGNQEIGDYRFIPTININPRYIFGQGTITGGGTISDAATANLQWETTTQTNFGLDYGFFGNRLSGSIDVYDKTTRNILLQAPIEASTGIDGRPTENVGKIRNQGLELSASYQENRGAFEWNLGGNISFLTNKVLSLTRGGESTAFITGGADNSNDGRPLTRAAVGEPVGVFYGFVVDRIYQNNSDIYYNNILDGNSGTTYGGSAIRPGDIRFKDLNNDGIINDADRTVLGSPIPKFTYGFNGRVGYKGFDLSVQFNGVYGSQIYNAARFWTEGMQRNFNYDSNTLNRWVSEAEPGNGSVPRANSSDANNGQVSNRYIEDGSFLRLRNLTLGYNFPEAIRARLGNIPNLRVYVTGNNLLTITNYTGYDPEIGSGYRQDPGAGNPANGANLNRNIDVNNYPVARSFMGGIRVTF